MLTIPSVGPSHALTKSVMVVIWETLVPSGNNLRV